MIVKKQFDRFCLTCVGVAIISFSIQPQAVAQTPIDSSPENSPTSVTPKLPPTVLPPSSSPNFPIPEPLLLEVPPFPPELPPLEPIFPEVADQTIRLVIQLNERKLYVYREDRLEITYPIAVGRPGWETPAGHFEVFEMLRNPGWTHPFTGEVIPAGPDSPLGERWIAFWTDGTNFIGFHGTPDRPSVGRAASHGCIRMFDEDIVALFEIVTMGTTVTVEP